MSGSIDLDLRPPWHRNAPERETEQLERTLSRAIGEPVTILARRPNLHASTFLAEVVRCRVGGTTVEILCKFGPAHHESGFGHRSGLGHEARVYASLIPPGLSAPQYFGTFTDEARQETWLFVEWLDDGLRVDMRPEAMPAAARWAGAFHRSHERPGRPEFLRRYDADYFLAWPPRARELAGDAEWSWHDAAVERFALAVPLLVEGPQTVVHGEYTVHNVVARSDGSVYPIDWQSAAVSAGEIDLAALTENWKPDVVAACEEAYVDARWGGEAPDAFRERLAAARLYLHFRWLGDPALVERPHRRLWRFDALRELLAADGRT